MEKEKLETTPNGQRPANAYDDGNIPSEDLPRDVIPDEVPRKDGPGGEKQFLYLKIRQMNYLSSAGFFLLTLSFTIKTVSKLPGTEHHPLLRD